jgi:DNA modification methylase
MTLQIHDYVDGTIVCGDFLDPKVQAVVRENGTSYSLALCDPPYGNILHSIYWDRYTGTDTEFVEWMIHWTKLIEEVLIPGGSFCCWGGIGYPGFRPFYKYIPAVEERTGFRMPNHLTWGKKRAYGTNNNYLFTREECAWFVLGEAKKPHVFNKPYLDQKRGYAGYDEKYPAHDDRLRRTAVWTDVTEIFKGKVHEAQKPVCLLDILVATHSNPGESVLDGFAGSGTVAVSCIKNKRRFMCVERDAVEYDRMRKRIDLAYEKDYYGDTPDI